MNSDKFDASVYLKDLNRKYRLIVNGDKFIENKSFNEARDYYLQLLNHELFINDYYPFLKLSIIYKELDDLENEVNIIKKLFSSGIYCDEKTFRYFKSRLSDLNCDGDFDELEKSFMEVNLKNKKLINLPVVSSSVVKKINYNQLSRDYKFFKDLLIFEEDSSLELKIKFKYKLIRTGDELLENYQYFEAIDYFNKLLKHSLFKNDAYSYLILSKVFKSLSQKDYEKKIILEFFNSEIYCDFDDFEYFKTRLDKLNYNNMAAVEKKYDKSRLNKDVSNVPVPSSKIIKEYYKPLNRCIGEKTVIESLIAQIPNDFLIDFERNHIVVDDVEEFDFKDDSSEVFEFTTVKNIDLKERILMINILKLIKSGVSRSQAAKILNCNILSLSKWFDEGKRKSNLNSFYFYSQLIKIDEKSNVTKYKNNKYDFSKSKIQEDNDNPSIIQKFTLTSEMQFLIDGFDIFINSPFYENILNKFILPMWDVEIIKNRIFDDILLGNIAGSNVDFNEVFSEYFKNFINFEYQLSDEEFEEIFDEIDTSNYSDDLIFDARIRTVYDFNSGRITKVNIKSRYSYNLKKINKEYNQLSRLEVIKENPNVPSAKKFLSQREVDDIYKMTENVIKSEHGLNGIVLDFVRYAMNSQINKNKKEAFVEFDKFNDKKHLMEITNLNERQVNDFINQFKFLINKNKIKVKDINENFIKKLGLNFLPSRKIIL